MSSAWRRWVVDSWWSVPSRLYVGLRSVWSCCTRRVVLRRLAIAVQPAEEEVAEEGEQHRGEPGHEQPGSPTSDPAPGHPGVQVGAVDEPGEQRGRLLGVPAPVAAPGDLGPDRAKDHGQGQQRESDDD